MNRDFPAVARRGVTAVAMVACAAGLGIWSAVLLAPSPSALPPALTAAKTQLTDTAAVSDWFGAGAVSRVKLVSSGLISAGDHGSAILSVDGGKPRAYGVGQALSADLVLAQVHATGVIVSQGGQDIEVNVPGLPPVGGITPAGARGR